jgi:hypothetical protein
MSRRARGRRWVALAGLVLAGLSGPASAGDTREERPATAQVAPIPVAVGPAPPFWVAGVVIGPARRSAILVPLDDARRELGVVTLHEGESYDNYRLVAVEPARVLLEQDGAVLALGVGRPYSGPRGAPEPGTRPTGPIFIPGPDKPKPDIEYTGPQVRRSQGSGSSGVTTETAPDSEQVQNFVERLFSHPQIQQQIEEIRPVVRQKMDRARQDGGAPAGSSAPTTQGPAR